MSFGAGLQTGREVRNICISIATLKVNSSQSLFPPLVLPATAIASP